MLAKVETNTIVAMASRQEEATASVKWGCYLFTSTSLVFFSPGHFSTCLEGRNNTGWKAKNASCDPTGLSNIHPLPAFVGCPFLSRLAWLTVIWVHTTHLISQESWKRSAKSPGDISQRLSVWLSPPPRVFSKQPELSTWAFICNNFSYLAEIDWNEAHTQGSSRVRVPAWTLMHIKKKVSGWTFLLFSFPRGNKINKGCKAACYSIH